MALPLNVNWYN